MVLSTPTRLVARSLAGAARSSRSRLTIRQGQAYSRCFSSQSSTAPSIFPNEREGVTYDLNWSLVADNVAPGNVAYRNAESSTLSKFSDSCTQKECDVALVPEGLSDYEFDVLHNEVSDHLCNVEAVFAHDGSFAGTKARVITDSPTIAKAAASLLGSSAGQLADTRPLVAYVATTMGGEDVVAAGSVDSENESVKVVFKGCPTNDALSKGLDKAIHRLKGGDE